MKPYTDRVFNQKLTYRVAFQKRKKTDEVWVHLYFHNVHPVDWITGKGLEVGLADLGKDAFCAFVGRTLHDIAQVLKAQHMAWDFHEKTHRVFKFKLRPFYELESRLDLLSFWPQVKHKSFPLNLALVGRDMDHFDRWTPSTESLNNASVDVWVKTVYRHLNAYLRYSHEQHEAKMQALRASKTKPVKKAAFEFDYAIDSDPILLNDDLSPLSFRLRIENPEFTFKDQQKLKAALWYEKWLYWFGYVDEDRYDLATDRLDAMDPTFDLTRPLDKSTGWMFSDSPWSFTEKFNNDSAHTKKNGGFDFKNNTFSMPDEDGSSMPDEDGSSSDDEDWPSSNDEDESSSDEGENGNEQNKNLDA